MLRAKRHWSWVIILTCCLSSFGFTQNEPLAQRLSADESALRTLAGEFFAAYAKNDLNGFLQLWSAKSPGLDSRKRMTQKLFADNEKIEINSLAVRKVIVSGEKAQVRLAVKMSAVEAKTGKPAGDFGENRVLHCIKEEGVWKIWREASAEGELAALMAAAGTDEEREALLAAEKDLMNARLAQALGAQGNRFYNQSDFP